MGIKQDILEAAEDSLNYAQEEWDKYHPLVKYARRLDYAKDQYRRLAAYAETLPEGT
jgi:hypothetical protein